eukprot:163547_1
MSAFMDLCDFIFIITIIRIYTHNHSDLYNKFNKKLAMFKPTQTKRNALIMRTKKSNIDCIISITAITMLFVICGFIIVSQPHQYLASNKRLQSYHTMEPANGIIEPTNSTIKLKWLKEDALIKELQSKIRGHISIVHTIIGNFPIKSH